MSFFKRVIDKIPRDKKDHVLLGIIVGFPLVLTFGFYGGLVGILFVGSIELYQKYFKKGNPEWWDFIASALPIVMFLIFRYLYYLYN